MRKSIPEGHEFLAGKGQEKAREAIALAVGRGFPAESVAKVQDGFYIPLGADAETPAGDGPDETWKVSDIKKFAEDQGIDLGDAKNKGEYLQVIAGWSQGSPNTEEKEQED